MDISRLNNTIFESPRLGELSVVVVGAGALGNEVVKALGLLNIGKAVIVDPGIVEPSNLSRSIFFRETDCGNANKAKALAKAAALLFPDTQFSAFACEVADVGTEVLRSADILFSCVDSDLSRLEIAYLSTRFQLRVSEGGLGGQRFSHGRVSWFPGRQGACFGCKLPARRRRELLTLWKADAIPCAAPVEEGIRPSTPTMSAIIGSMQVELGLRNFFARSPISESVELSLDGQPELRVFKNIRAVECPFHDDVPETFISSWDDETPDQILSKAGFAPEEDPYIRLDWPVCVGARCQACGFEWAPMLRLALFRRLSSCPSCASYEVWPRKNLKTLKKGGPWGGYPLREFGIPAGNLISVRSD